MKKKKFSTTLDNKHKEQLNKFEQKKINLQKDLKELKKLEKELNEINNIDYKKYTQELVNRKGQLINKIKEIKKIIDFKQTDLDEALYFNDTIDYLSNYYEKKKKKEKKEKKKVEIKDFFNKTQMTKQKKENTKSQLLKKYMIATENIQHKVKKGSKFKPMKCIGENCNNDELVLHLSEGYLICTKCGICQEILLDSDKPNYKDPVPDSSAYAYKRLNHLNEWLAQFQAKETTDIPDEIYEKILLEIKKQKLINKRITPTKMREILKKLELNKYYEHLQHIINKVTGVPPPKITKEIEEKLRWMFREMQEPFSLYCPKNRKNFLNYAFTLHKCFQLLELDDYLPCFPLLKSRDKLKEQDILWEKICNHLGWEFISSL